MHSGTVRAIVMAAGIAVAGLFIGGGFARGRAADRYVTVNGVAEREAREAAQQFAHDSRSGIGAIRQASQGVFEIQPRDQAPGISEESQTVKTVRVVSAIDYFLRN